MWSWSLTNYGISDGVRVCPSTRPQSLAVIDAPGAADLAWVGAGVGVSSMLGSYGANGWLTQFVTPSGPAFGYGSQPQLFFGKLLAVTKPSLTPLFFDQNYLECVPLEDDEPADDLYWGQTPDTIARDGMGCCTILRHGGPTASSSVAWQRGRPLPGAINMNFADGHGELVKLTSLWNYSWHLHWTNTAPKL
ncbi:MAG TPA: hypothetical protein VGO59_11860 [Verrucomicrobiae bacterium]